MPSFIRRRLFGAGAGIAALLLASSAAQCAPARGAFTPAQFRALEARVQVLEDKDAIRELLVQYGHTLDTHDLAGYSRLFAKDGEWIGGFGSAKGPDAILALMRKYIGDAPFDATGVKGFHLLTNMIVRVHGDRATALSKIVFMAREPDGKPVPVMGGHYDDTLIREDGTWKFLRRVVMMDIPYQDPRMIVMPPPPRPTAPNP